ncbi:DUF732 domain-containing protein [Streptomyces sp. NPDC057910]|uniref:DUF732 domain-containing protein n=1 Tax=Streptomyces sp. NPDC057910 TaxID=3346278 RepID=UPI0036EC79AD
MDHTRTAVVTVLVAAGLLLAGCSSSTPPKADGRPATVSRPSASSPDETSDAARKSAAEDAGYVVQARKGDPSDFTNTDASIISSAGRDICKMLNAGQTVEAVVTRTQQDFNDQATGALVGAAPALCPGQADKVNAWIASLK